MQIFPVLDLMDGNVVRGVAGERDSYRAIESRLTASSEPSKVAQAIKEQLGLSQFYVADLDAIRFSRPQFSVLQELANSFPGLWLDAGIRIPDDLSRLESLGEIVFVAGLETIAGPEALRDLCQRLGADHVAFSLDLKHGRPLGDASRWHSPEPLEIARQAIDLGARKLIVLDLAQVGMGEGLSTLPICANIKREFPEVFLVTGGGIRGAGDLLSLKEKQIDGVLIASALHNGSLGNEEIQGLGNLASG